MEGKHDDNGRWRPYEIKLNLVDVPDAGTVQTTMRTTDKDKRDINKAAAALNIDQAAFMRLAAVGLARTVLSEVARNSKSTFQGGQDGASSSSTG